VIPGSGIALDPRDRRCEETPCVPTVNAVTLGSMIAILVHWSIKKGRESEFESRWHQMTVESGKGLYRELLTTIDETVDNPKFQTFSVADPHYTTYVNIGLWETVEHFDRAVGKYIPEAIEEIRPDGRTRYTIEVEGYEFRLRERVVLKIVSDRGGELPAAMLTQ
jgi:hypothetical protein